MVQGINPHISIGTWSAVYVELDFDPGLLPCGCPNQDLDQERPLWERQVIDILWRLRGEDLGSV